MTGRAVPVPAPSTHREIVAARAIAPRHAITFLPYGSGRTALLLFLGVSLLLAALSKGTLLDSEDAVLFDLIRDLAENGDIRRAPSDESVDGLRTGVGFPLVAIPAYWFANTILDPLLPLDTQRDETGTVTGDERVYGVALLNAMLGGLTIAATYLLALALSYRRATALIVALLLATGTTLAWEVVQVRPEPLLALALTNCVYALVRAGLTDPDPAPGASRWLLVSGFFAGLTLATRPELAIVLIPVALWLGVSLVREWWPSDERTPAVRAASFWFMPVLVSAATVAWGNWERFGNVVAFGERSASGTVDTSFAEGVYGLLLSPGRGLLTYNPPLLLTLVGVGIFVVARPGVGLTILGMLVAAVGYYASGDAWTRGASWGPRELAPLLPLLVLPAGEIVEAGFNAVARRASWVIFTFVGLVALAGVALATLGVVVRPEPAELTDDRTASQIRAAIFDADMTPLSDRADRFSSSIDTPDFAARYYDATFLWYGSAVVAWLGLLCLVVVIRRTLYPPVKPLPVERRPPPGWDDVPRC